MNCCVPPGKEASPKHNPFKALCQHNVESSFKDRTLEKSNPKMNPREELEFHHAQRFLAQVLHQIYPGDIRKDFFMEKHWEGLSR